MTSPEVYSGTCLEEEKLRVGRFLAEIQTRYLLTACNLVVSLCLAVLALLHSQQNESPNFVPLC
jgi:hypothetical protein